MSDAASGIERFVWRAESRELALTQHENLVEAQPGAIQVVGGHHDRDAMLGHDVRRLDNLAFRLLIDAAEGFVQQQHTGVLRQGAGDENAPALPAA